MRVWLVVVVLMLNQFQTIILRCTHAYCVSHSECHRLTCTDTRANTQSKSSS